MAAAIQIGQRFVRTDNTIRPFDQSLNYWCGKMVEVIELGGSIATIQVLDDRDYDKCHVSIASLTDPNLFLPVERK